MRMPVALVERLLIPAGVLLGAALLFLLEPMIAKIILPWFGGSAEVWTSCLLFFQLALCAGYFYAYAASRWLTPPQQRLLHMGLLLASVALLPIIPAASWRSMDDTDPLLRILELLTATIGLPFVLLSAGGPLLQSWLVQFRTADMIHRPPPFRLFAISNAGSILALASYPLLAEPLLRTSTQANSWSALYLLYVALVIAIGFATWPHAGTASSHRSKIGTVASEGRSPLIWLLLAACPSMLLLSVTNHITQNVAGMPLLWVVPLALYLLSFILCFDADRWYRRPIFSILFGELFLAMMYAAVRNRANSDPFLLLALFSAGLFVACMSCHGELALRRPDGERLTLFYLVIAVGGALGGMLVAVVAPLVLPALFDMPIALGCCGLMIIFVVFRPEQPRATRGRWLAAFAVAIWFVGVLYVAVDEYLELHGDLLLARNFYGALRVEDLPATGDTGPIRSFFHGTIVHGEEYLDPARRCEPTTYYAPDSGAGIAVRTLERSGPISIGVIGLGAGTLAAYARPGDAIDFFELDPLVAEIARRYFGYLDECGSQARVVLGDGRLSLAQQPQHKYDVIVLDAFSGDAIPVHLLTREAFELYGRQLKSEGVIAVHVSNQFIDLAPIVARAAQSVGKVSRLVSSGGDPRNAAFPAQWVLVASDDAFFTEPMLAAARPIDLAGAARPWTDDYSDLWSALRW